MGGRGGGSLGKRVKRVAKKIGQWAQKIKARLTKRKKK